MAVQRAGWRDRFRIAGKRCQASCYQGKSTIHVQHGAPAGIVDATALLRGRRRAIEIFREAIVLTIATLFPIMNPFSTAPLFISLTAGLDERTRNRTALAACLYAFGILVAFLLLGAAIIDFFGISVAGIRVAGGLIISVLGFRMLFPPAPVHPSQGSAFRSWRLPSRPWRCRAWPGPAPFGRRNRRVPNPEPSRRRLLRDPHRRDCRDDGDAADRLFHIPRASSLARLLGPSGIDALTRIFGFLLSRSECSSCSPGSAISSVCAMLR